MINLENYFRACDNRGIIDHVARAIATVNNLKFYIHPLDASGNTLDFQVIGNTLIPMGKDGKYLMNFGAAIEAMKHGKKVARSGWNGKGIFIALQVPDEFSKMSQPYIYIDTTGLETKNPAAPKGRVPWLASQTDMLAEDYIIVE